jgi:hypothetical protein
VPQVLSRPLAAHGRGKAGSEQWDVAASAQWQAAELEGTVDGGAGGGNQGVGASTSYGVVDSWDSLRVGEGTARDGAGFVHETAGPYTVAPEEAVELDTLGVEGRRSTGERVTFRLSKSEWSDRGQYLRGKI